MLIKYYIFCYHGTSFQGTLRLDSHQISTQTYYNVEHFQELHTYNLFERSKEEGTVGLSKFLTRFIACEELFFQAKGNLFTGKDWC